MIPKRSALRHAAARISRPAAAVAFFIALAVPIAGPALQNAPGSGAAPAETAAALARADAARPATRLASTEKSPTTLADLPAQVQAAIHAALGRDRASYHAEALDEGFRLANPAHRLEARFNEDGAALQVGTLRWNLRLIALGYGETLTELPARRQQASGRRADAGSPTFAGSTFPFCWASHAQPIPTPLSPCEIKQCQYADPTGSEAEPHW